MNTPNFQHTQRHHETLISARLGGLGHLDESRSQSFLREIVTSGVQFGFRNCNCFDNAVNDTHSKSLAAANNSNRCGTWVCHFHAKGFGELTSRISKHGDHAALSALVLFPGFHNSSIVDAVHDDFVVSCLLKCVLRLEVPRYLTRRSSGSECSRKANNRDLSSGNMFCHVYHRWGESRVQFHSRKLGSRSDGRESSGVSTEVGC
mmetsp:Transcript_3008/g.8573  ORF Transcript_3008/g.8573 Transcript_3008/m.8573 type:complete len:205 (-) Transcript_3008:113-727(-)